MYQKISLAVQEGEIEEVDQLTIKSLEKGNDPLDVLNNALMSGIEIVGQKFADGELFIPEVMMCAQALQAGIDRLNPFLKQDENPHRAKIVIGTVANDVHDLGKNLVKMMLTANGYEVIDMGVNVSAEEFAGAVRGHNPDVVGMSALITTTMLEMSKTIEYIKTQGLHNGSLKILVGGAPVTEKFAKEIGADLYADDAIEAARILREIL
ncbi:MAG: corrinoid protein [Clostridiales bacterium]|nr:corrinoid protein [Clostridiales bacterium]MCF8023245.1 corrinoid protein [Clostridiales bacterium]